MNSAVLVATGAGRRSWPSIGHKSPPRRITASLLACLALAASSPFARTAAAADPFLVLAEAADAEPLPLPSVAKELKSFDDVSKAVSDERSRVAALEARIRELEKAAKAATERLPPPATTEAAKAKDGGAAAGKDEKKDDKKDDKKPADDEYEVGTDLNMPTKWNYLIGIVLCDLIKLF